MNEYQQLTFSLRAMTAYRSLLCDRVVKSLMDLLDGSGVQADEAAGQYGELVGALMESGMTLSDYIYHAVLYDDNPYTRLCAAKTPIPAGLLEAVRHDLHSLGQLAHIAAGQIKEMLCERYPQYLEAVRALPEYTVGHVRFAADERDWANEAQAFSDFCAENGCGDWARYHLHAPQDEAMLRLLDSCDERTRQLLAVRLRGE